MRNEKVMEKVKELEFQRLDSREQSMRVMVQIAIIRKAFGVKNDESEKLVTDYERNVILSDDEITKEFEKRYDFLNWAIEENDIDNQRKFKAMIEYFIDGVSFFNNELAEKFKLQVSV